MRILFSSANPVVLRRWRELLSSTPGEQAATLAEAKRHLTVKKFDLVLLHRPLVDQQSFTDLQGIDPGTRFMLLSDRPYEEEGLSFLKAGISGYANTYISPDLLKEAVRVIIGGGVWLGQQIIQRLIQDMAAGEQRRPEAEAGQALPGLTKMERMVADMVARGLANAQIAEDLKITERTVKAHLTSIYGKTKTGNRLGLAVLMNRG
ncbi:DNA-binding response regulator, NarL/FixJ family, contains REC and HTH domains [Desulfonatronum thiosulfatophilum]|uniref:DNA-binding response regulator, NarL/FixJ family, contains REC and HTH domains n=1 Tax=Desulfonatronum thiosulfatophilum TaxID=617002 RepID=A0A1G6CME3_9BACT|nr:response regulator transcription factor [Desulfonatronum thiosulfatophilum]SDB34024.1 DNA-binding response regulator, NarL/FixJ family, contains REC and HTH domains [Desulfonatronum thiosulfatophilum]